MNGTPDVPPRRARYRTSPAATWVGTPLVVLALLIVMAVIATPLLRAATGTGTKGTFIATNFRCSGARNGGTSCTWYGTFTADSGQAVYGVPYNFAYPPLSDGTSMPAQEVGFVREIGVAPLRLRGTDRWLGPFGLLLVLWPLLWLAGWAWVVPVRYARWRRRAGGSPLLPAGGKRIVPPPCRRVS